MALQPQWYVATAVATTVVGEAVAAARDRAALPEHAARAVVVDRGGCAEPSDAYHVGCSQSELRSFILSSFDFEVFYAAFGWIARCPRQSHVAESERG